MSFPAAGPRCPGARVAVAGFMAGVALTLSGCLNGANLSLPWFSWSAGQPELYEKDGVVFLHKFTGQLTVDNRVYAQPTGDYYTALIDPVGRVAGFGQLGQGNLGSPLAQVGAAAAAVSNDYLEDTAQDVLGAAGTVNIWSTWCPNDLVERDTGHYTGLEIEVKIYYVVAAAIMSRDWQLRYTVGPGEAGRFTDVKFVDTKVSPLDAQALADKIREAYNKRRAPRTWRSDDSLIRRGSLYGGEYLEGLH